MILLFAAALLLSVSPLVVTFLHVRFGLKWRANALLGRLDTVLELNARDNTNPETKRNLENQLTELYFHVWGFASAEKFQEMKQIHRRKTNGSSQPAVFKAIYGNVNAKDADGNSQGDNDGDSKFHWNSPSAWNNLRYHLPAGFLAMLYLIGFLVVLVWYPVYAASSKSAPTAPQAPVTQTSASPSTANTAASAPPPGVGGQPPAPGTAKPAQAAPNASAAQTQANTAQNATTVSPANTQPPTASQAVTSGPGAVNGANGTSKQGGQGPATPASNEKLTWGQRMVCWLQELLALCGNIGSSCVSLWTACAGEPLNPPIYLVYTFLGAFVFNTGIMVRRIFVWDISGQMFWWSAYRVVLSLGLAAVLNFTTEKLDPHYYFLVAPASVAIFDQLVRNLRAKLLQSDAAPKRNEMSLQLIQGVDYWKEQRLLEEGIESVQHLATADFVALALFTRSPLYTIMDWVDQAIFIQRFPGKADRMADQGLPVSAVELTWSWDPANRQRFESRRPPDSAVPPPNAPAAGSYAEYLQFLADATGAKPGVVARTLDAWSNDNQVQLLTLFWRADLGGDETATGPV